MWPNFFQLIEVCVNVAKLFSTIGTQLLIPTAAMYMCYHNVRDYQFSAMTKFRDFSLFSRVFSQISRYNFLSKQLTRTGVVTFKKCIDND